MDEENNEMSTIRVRKTTIKKLEVLKLVESETLDSVISRIIKYAPTVEIVIKPNNVNTVDNAKTEFVDGQDYKS
jgi:nitrogen regulatory protein PII